MSRYLRVSVQGQLPGGEVWSVNPVFQPLMPPFTATETTLATVAQSIATLTVPATLLGLLSSSSTITGVRCEARSDSFELEVVGEYIRPAALSGSGTASKPNQSAVVLSLRTAGVGARARGRMYWPAIASTLSTTTGRIASPTNTATAEAGAQYLKLIADAIGVTLTGVDTWNPVVFSRVSNTSRIVNAVWVGDVLDTQRRRRDNLPENYARNTYPDT